MRPVSRPRLDWNKYQPRVRSNAQQTLQPGRFEALTPAERDRLEEERRERLLGWFSQRGLTTADDADDLGSSLVKLFQELSKEDCGEFNIFRWLNILKEL